MKTPVTFALTLLLTLSLAACTRAARMSPTPVPAPGPSRPSLIDLITIEGLRRRQELTSYQYGTHILLDPAGHTLYALRTATLNLDTLAGGPPLLDVTEVLPAAP